MSKIDLDPITSGYNLSKINANFQKVEDELNNKVLYRNSPTGEPNSMSSNLDMNGNKILNVVTGASPSDLATRGYVDEEISEERVYVDQQLGLVNSELDTKYDKTGGPVFGDINLNGHKLIGASEVQTSKTSTSILEINGVPVVPGNSVIDPYNGTREALRRSYAEAGYNLVDGSFEAGGTLVNANDVLLQERTGKGFTGPTGTVVAGTNPVSGEFVDKSGGLLRHELATSNGATKVGTSDGVSVQDFIDDYDGFTDALLAEAGIVDDGLPDTVGNSQRVDAMKELFQDHSLQSNRDISDSHPSSAISSTISNSIASVEVASYMSGLASVQQKLLGGQTLVKLKFYGDSLTYGFDLGGGGAPINGSSDARAATPYPESVAAAVSLLSMQSSAPVVLNRGFPGDTSENWRTRWVTAEHADAVFIMYGTNDALPVSGVAKVSVERFKTNIRDLIIREADLGAKAIVLLQPPALQNGAENNATVQFRNRNLGTYRQAMLEIAKEFNLLCVDTSELVGWMGSYAYSDNTHFNRYGYNELGFNLASVLMPNGEKISYKVGDTITPLNSNALGTVTIDANSRHQFGGNRVVFSLIQASRELLVYGRFDQDCDLAVQSINSSGNASNVLVSVGGGDLSGLTSQTLTVTNSGSSLSKRATKAIKVRRGYRVIRLFSQSVGTVEELSVTQSAITSTASDYVKLYDGVKLYPAGTSLQSMLSSAEFPAGASVRLDSELPITGAGVIIQGQSGTGNYIWLMRLNTTSLYIRKFVGVTSSDQTITGVFTAGVDNYSISMHWAPASDEILISVNGTQVASVAAASSAIKTSGSRIGVFSSGNTLPASITNILSSL